MLTPDGKPRQDLWVADGIHSNHEGYLLRVKIMRSILGEPKQKGNQFNTKKQSDKENLLVF
jgi:hypothetical protein